MFFFFIIVVFFPPLFRTDVSPRVVTSPGRLVWDTFHSCFIAEKTAALTALSVKVTVISQYRFVRIFCQLYIKHSCPLLFHSFSSASKVVLTFLPPLFSFVSVLSSSFLMFISLLLCLYFSTSTLPSTQYIYTHSFAVLSPCQKRSLTTDNSLPFLLLNPYTTFRYCLHAKFPGTWHSLTSQVSLICLAFPVTSPPPGHVDKEQCPWHLGLQLLCVNSPLLSPFTAGTHNYQT